MLKELDRVIQGLDTLLCVGNDTVSRVEVGSQKTDVAVGSRSVSRGFMAKPDACKSARSVGSGATKRRDQNE